MLKLILILAAVLVVAIAFTIFRVARLVAIAKNKDRKDPVDVSTNNLHATLFVLLPLIGAAAVVWYTNSADDMYLPLASEHGEATDGLFWTTMAIIIAMFVVTNVGLFAFSYMYRYKRGQKAHFYPHNNTLEAIWTAVPAIILLVLVLNGWLVWRKVMSEPPKEAQVVEIMGHQFAWKVRYPGKDGELGNYSFRFMDATNEMGVDLTDKRTEDDILPPEIHLVKGKPVLFKIRSRDVIHSVFAPHFRLKMDAVPGMPTQFWFTPTKTTAEMRQELSQLPNWQRIDPKTGKPRYESFNYEIACTEVCGRGHFGMRLVVVVETEEEFKAWLAKQQPWTQLVGEDYVQKARVRQALVKEGKYHSVNDVEDAVVMQEMENAQKQTASLK
ncbi:cytochrome c oxidase subunit II [Thermonema rossianum]|uniref:cytochrome c oxidase subunit II n=1 Tax=Thermonema rossianum TaxID=55505 RepID=UPI0008FF89DC|nr:cytochrome c oxidase subunit II [Thermonema rossianum]